MNASSDIHDDPDLDPDEAALVASAGGAAAISWEAPEGFRSGFACFVGRPNAGKSTFMHALCGLEGGSARRVHLHDRLLSVAEPFGVERFDRPPSNRTEHESAQHNRGARR